MASILQNFLAKKLELQMKLCTRWAKTKITKKKDFIKVEGIATKHQKWFSFLNFVNLFGFKFGLIPLIFLAYLSWEKDVFLNQPGWITFPQDISWEHAALSLLIVRILIIYIIDAIIEYIKKHPILSEKQKKHRINFLALLKLITLPINFPIFGAMISYFKGNEIILNSLFFGKFLRKLTEKERKDSYDETVQGFLEKSNEISKESLDQLKEWTVEKAQKIYAQYDHGSVFATKYLSKELEKEKAFLKMGNKIDSLNIENWVDETMISQANWWTSLYENTLFYVNFFNPWCANWQTLIFSWGALLGIGLISFSTSKWLFIEGIKRKKLNEDVEITARAIKQAELNENIARIVKKIIKKKVTPLTTKFDSHCIETDNRFIDVVGKYEVHETLIKSVQATLTIRELANISIKEKRKLSQEKIDEMIQKRINWFLSRELPSVQDQRFPSIPRTNNFSLSSQPRQILSTQPISSEKKKEKLQEIFKKFDKEPLTWNECKENFKEILIDIITS